VWVERVGDGVRKEEAKPLTTRREKTDLIFEV
jgi:hypothetical protein